MNGTMARMQDLIASQRRFIADASHQLRTPLAVLKTQAELALRENDAAAMRAIVASIAGTTDSAIHLANRLLTLARIEHSTGAIGPLPTGRVRVGRALPPRVEGNELIFSPPGIWSYGWRSYALDLTSAGERVRPILDGISLTALREGHPLAVGVLAFGTPDAATAVVERSSGAILATLPMPPGRHPAALCADGTSEIGNIRQIDRGYERIDERLRGLGARIERVATERVPA